LGRLGRVDTKVIEKNGCMKYKEVKTIEEKVPDIFCTGNQRKLHMCATEIRRKRQMDNVKMNHHDDWKLVLLTAKLANLKSCCLEKF